MLELQAVDGYLELFGGLFVVAITQVQLTEVKICKRVLLIVSDGIIISGNGLVGKVDATIAFCQFLGTLTFECPFLVGRLTISLLVLGGGIVILTDGIVLVALLHSQICTATGEQYGDDGYHEYGEVSSHIIIITI